MVASFSKQTNAQLPGPVAQTQIILYEKVRTRDKGLDVLVRGRV
jgi:hypothetical protein